MLIHVLWFTYFARLNVPLLKEKRRGLQMFLSMLILNM